MKYILYLFITLFGFQSFSQNEELAKEYFDRGEFQKALLSYEKLYKEKKGNSNYFNKIVEIHQQLENYDISEKLLVGKSKKNSNPQYLVDLGYNFYLKGFQNEAEKHYERAVLKIEDRPVYGYYVARRFEAYALINFAARAYERTMELRPDANYHAQLARIYGEQGLLEKMFVHYLDFLEIKSSYASQVKRSFSDYITENADGNNNIMLRKILIKKMQSQPNVLWNQLLSWLYIQQRDYSKAFAQEKAIYLREQRSLSGILELGNVTLKENYPDISQVILTYLIDNADDIETIIEAHKKRLELQIQFAEPKVYEEINQKYHDIIITYEYSQEVIDIMISHAHFKAFYLNKSLEAITYLKKMLKMNFNDFQNARIKLELGDILVFQQKFNEALIYYSQIQANLKNSVLSQEARFRVAKTSYYKGDFKWAESQLKVLKASTSQLIANDALDLKLLISDNKYEDSTQTALKLYAKADLYAYQNKTIEAIVLLDDILENHKTETIVDQALYKQAQLYEKQKEYLKAEKNYKAIIANYKEDILADDAYFALAELYNNVLSRPIEAQGYYEQIIFNHADSIHFIEARRKFRELRGDDLN